MRLIVPKGASGGSIHLALALRTQTNIEIYELNSLQEGVSRIDPCSVGNRETWLVPCREARLLLGRAKLLAGTMEMFLSAVAIRDENSQRLFEPALLQLLNELEAHRHPLASETRHTLYRQQAERWLEALVRNDVTHVDPVLDPRFVYAQVFANSCSEHGILDVLTVTRGGRLAIVELKTTEHIHLPLQAAEYWLRIRRHLQQGDFPRYGYFHGLELQPAAPIVYLVAPSLRFHPSTDALLRHLSPEMEVIRVGVTEN